MEQQKGSFKNSEHQDPRTDAQPVSHTAANVEEGPGVVTHANPKSRDDNRGSKGQEADRALGD